MTNKIYTQLAAYTGTNRFLVDLKAKAKHFGELTPRQLDAAQKALAREAAPKTAAPSGKVTVQGTVATTKYSESIVNGRIFTTPKMRVVTPEGWAVWVTIPNDLAHQMAAQDMTVHGLQGLTVRFDATLTPSDDPSFAFGKRPSKATIVN